MNRIEYLEVRVSGDLDRSHEMLRVAIAEGNVWAKVALAQLYSILDRSPAECGALLEEAENEVLPDDLDAQLEFVKAYELMISEVSVEESMRRRFKHVLALAEHHSDPVYKLEVARAYAYGIATDAPNLEAARHWYAIAMEAGEERAEIELARLTQRGGKRP